MTGPRVTSRDIGWEGLSAPAWGIDWGTRKIELAVVGSSGLLFRKRVSSEGDRGYDHVLDQIVKLVKSARVGLDLEPQRIGIGVPGNLDVRSNTLRTSPTRCLVDKPVHSDLSRILDTSVILENDARCFALAEARLGAGRDARLIFGVIMGGGVGGGLVIDGKLLQGANGIAGEWGHNKIIPEGGDFCTSCGGNGCVETVLSGPSLERAYERLAGVRRTLPGIVRLYENEHNEHAQLTLERLYKFFGISLASVVNLFDPDVIVLGGGVSNIEGLYTLGRDEVQRNISVPVEVTIRQNELGDSAGVFGAAMLSSSAERGGANQ